MNERGYTPEQVADAYAKLIYAQGLVDFVLRSGFDLRQENRAENEGSLISIFSILKDYLGASGEIMCDLESGYKDVFTKIWKEEENVK
jgi:hypothetical protein